jgi:hypothetical protein
MTNQVMVTGAKVMTLRGKILQNLKNLKPNFTSYNDDSEGEFEDSDYDDPKWMDDMDLRPKKK